MSFKLPPLEPATKGKLHQVAGHLIQLSVAESPPWTEQDVSRTRRKEFFLALYRETRPIIVSGKIQQARAWCVVAWKYKLMWGKV